MTSEANENRLDEFFKTEYKKLVRFVQKNMEKRYSDASPEDIVQDVTLSLLDKFNIDAQIENLAAYMYRSLRNKIYDTQTKKRHHVSLDGIENEKKINPALEDETEDKNQLNEFEPEQLRVAIEKLNNEDKYIINQTHFEGKSFQELSIELNTPLGTLLSRKHRAQAKLAKYLTTGISLK